MNPLRTSSWLRWVLALSLLFNLGFLTAFSVQWVCRTYCRQAEVPGESCQLYDHLHLTSEQRARADQARQRLLTDVGHLQQRLAAERKALMTLLLAPEPDSPAIQAQLERIVQAQSAVQRRVIDHFLTERRQLPPEQREAFQNVIRTWVCPRVGGGLAGDACGTECEDCISPETPDCSDHLSEKPNPDSIQ